MQTYEYLALPAPRKGVASKGIKGVPARFANAVTILMNEMAAEGWDYQRTDTLPCEERQGLTGKTVKYHAMLVFRRAIEQDEDDTEPPLALPVPDENEITAQNETASEDIHEDTVDEFPDEVDASDDTSNDKSDDTSKDR